MGCFEPDFQVFTYLSKKKLRYAKTWKSGFAKYAVDANLFRLGSSIQKHAGSRGTAPRQMFFWKNKILIEKKVFFQQLKKY